MSTLKEKPLPATPPLPTAALFSYAVLALPLAFALLPVYVHMPNFYAHETGMSLAVIGAILLATRFLDAALDPLIGHWIDTAKLPSHARSASHLHTARRIQLRRIVLLASPFLALGFFALFHPPADGLIAVAWLTASLIVTYIAFSCANIAYQGWGSLLADNAVGRARVSAVREAFGLVGVIAAASLPTILGIGSISWLLIGLLTAALLLAWFVTRRADSLTLLPDTAADENRVGETPTTPLANQDGPTSSVWRSLRRPFENRFFSPLFRVFILNGIASSIPATLIVFFVQDRLLLPSYLGLFLAAYFLCGAAGMPLWLVLARRIGQKAAWVLAILLSVVCFVWAFLLGPGDLLPFLGVCIGSGLALGAELALPPALLAGVIARGGHTGTGEGAYFGLWNAATKFNLALAAGLVLPLLGWLGYDPNAPTAQGVAALTWSYTLLPCVLKLSAAALLWFSPLEDNNDNI